jgi:hypothetical protein
MQRMISGGSSSNGAFRVGRLGRRRMLLSGIPAWERLGCILKYPNNLTLQAPIFRVYVGAVRSKDLEAGNLKAMDLEDKSPEDEYPEDEYPKDEDSKDEDVSDMKSDFTVDLLVENVAKACVGQEWMVL